MEFSGPEAQKTPWNAKHSRGAGGNRTLVRQVVTQRATTIPVFLTHGSQLVGSSGHEAPPPDLSPMSAVFAGCQWSFPTVHQRFWCQAAMVRPRVALLLAMTLYLLT